nr:phage tail protein [Pantoea sp. 201603H]
MPAGTISLINNSMTVSGNGTVFSNELKQNDFIVVVVGGVTYTLGINSVNSANSATLNTAYNGPTISGVAWTAIPNQTLVGITAQISADVAKAIRGLNADKQNWQQVFSSNGSVTVTLPDGSQFSGPSWNSISTNFSGKLDKSQNLNDLTDKEKSRNNLGLGAAATKGFSGSSDYLMSEGVGGWWASTSPNGVNDGRYNEKSGFYAGPGAAGINYFDAYAPMMVMCRYPFVYGMLQISPNSGRAAVRGRNGDNFSQWNELYTTGNTTKASDGTLKAASPVARIVNSRELCERDDIDEEGFEWCGDGTCNEEAAGIKITRMDTGVYAVVGSLGLAKSGWKLLPPMDPGGMGELGVVEAEETDAGGITVRLYKRKYVLNEEGEIERTKGNPINVPVNSWIDIRLEMFKSTEEIPS